MRFPDLKYVMGMTVLTAVAFIPIFHVLEYSRWEKTKYILTKTELFEITGMIFTVRNRIKLFRIKDTSMVSGPINRYYNLNDIVIYSTDASNNRVTLECLENAKEVDDRLNKQIDLNRGEIKTILRD